MVSSYPDTQLLIDNSWSDAASGKTLDVLNPATGERVGRVAHASLADLDRALWFGGWPRSAGGLPRDQDRVDHDVSACEAIYCVRANSRA